VLVAYPVISLNRVIGAIYISRTPPRFESYFSEEGVAFLLLIGATLLGALTMGTFLVRVVLRPLQALRDQSRLVARGAHDDLAPLNHYGLREIAEMGDAVMTMATSLSQRSKEIGIYTNHVTHELKSPVSTIVGAAELLEAGDLPQDVQQQLVASIKGQGDRMGKLLDQLREVARSRQNTRGGPGLLRDMLPSISGLEIALADRDPTLPLSIEHGQTILTHLAQNARNHGADHLELEWNGETLRMSDNGRGFADIDLERLSEPFFTTRRDAGGTGLGLAIVVAILDLYDARLSPIRSESGAVFEITFPLH
jgi:signal transduction histidine kinase